MRVRKLSGREIERRWSEMEPVSNTTQETLLLLLLQPRFHSTLVPEGHYIEVFARLGRPSPHQFDMCIGVLNNV